jgi:putative molybdopterin biosynthesis protein
MAKSRPAAPAGAPSAEMLDTREVAAYLRLKERRIYDLVRRQAIPHVRATGKLLFPRERIDAWLRSKSEGVDATASPRTATRRAPPSIIAGSHDPLLEWAARESGCGLAILACGSRAGIARLAAGEATAAAVHWRDSVGDGDNVELIRATFGPGEHDVVALEWARRRQGLLLPPGNPRRVRGVVDLARRKLRVVARQPGAGSHRLFEQLLAAESLAPDALHWTPGYVHAETEVATAIAEGRADAGLGIEAAARERGLDFIALATERVDLVCRRRDAFEPPLQALLAFGRGKTLAATARSLGGYDIARLGGVSLNL